MKKIKSYTLFLSLACLFTVYGRAQMVTGVWKGKIGRQTVEVKIIRNGDSLTGTSYYYTSPANFRRYSIKGYYDPNTNETVWWDDRLIEQKSGKNSLSSPGKIPMIARADFNCPGSGKMMLDGKAAAKENEDRSKGEVHLDKSANTGFADEWDFVIDNYTVGANDPYIIDSINAIALAEPVEVTVPPAPVQDRSFSLAEPKAEPRKEVLKTIREEPVNPGPAPEKIQTIEEKFTLRKKEYITEIPVTGDSIELRFYDNAQVDGDSISLFLNDKLVFEHIRLTASAYTIKIASDDLQENNDLVMVAENLGSIPPNTSYMVAYVNDRKYEAMLTSTEQTSAAIKLVKAPAR